MDFEPTLSSRFMVYIRDYLMDCKIDPMPVFAECGMSFRGEHEYDPPVSVSEVAKLFEVAGQITHNDSVGVSIAQRYHYESAGLMILLMLAAPSVEEGVKTLCSYDKYMDTAIETDFAAGPTLSEFSFNLINPKQTKADQLSEFLAAFFIGILNKATRKKVPVTEAWLCHDNTRNIHALEDFLDAPVKFGQPTSKIVFDSSYLKERFFSSNSLLYEVLVNAFKTHFFSQSKKNGFIEVVCREVARLRMDEPPSLSVVASNLAMSERTLKRRLSEEGYSFQEVKNITREERAKYFLANTAMPLAEIGYKLGYSELSAFSRAFRSWTGESPQFYRDKVRKLLAG